jgi:predicted metal-dependent hydrolase
MTWTDEQLGEILVVRNTRARNIIMRPMTNGVRVTCPPLASVNEIKETLEFFRQKLAEKQSSIQQGRVCIDSAFSIRTDVLEIAFASAQQYNDTMLHQGQVYIKRDKGRSILYLSPQTDFAKMQDWLKKVLAEELRLHAKIYLPCRTEEIAREYGFRYSGVKIQSSKTCWGSCSARNSINLSLFLMAVPSHLIDYVIKHELCHTVHHDHGDKFWQLMDNVTDGRAKQLRMELKKYRTSLT